MTEYKLEQKVRAPELQLSEWNTGLCVYIQLQCREGMKWWWISLFYLWLHFLSFPHEQKPADRSSWTAGCSWRRCTPKGSAISFSCSQNQFNAQTLAQECVSFIYFFLTVPASCGKTPSSRSSRGHRWEPSSAQGRCGLGTQKPELPRQNPPEVSPGIHPVV